MNERQHSPLHSPPVARASAICEVARDLCSRIEASHTLDGTAIQRRCKAVVDGAYELLDAVPFHIDGDCWHYPSRSRRGSKWHVVTSYLSERGQQRYVCSCEAGPQGVCWHRGHRAVVAELLRRQQWLAELPLTPPRNGHAVAALADTADSQALVDELYPPKG
jgi:hypothetical protein